MTTRPPRERPAGWSWPVDRSSSDGPRSSPVGRPGDFVMALFRCDQREARARLGSHGTGRRRIRKAIRFPAPSQEVDLTRGVIDVDHPLPPSTGRESVGSSPRPDRPACRGEPNHPAETTRARHRCRRRTTKPDPNGFRAPFRRRSWTTCGQHSAGARFGVDGRQPHVLVGPVGRRHVQRLNCRRSRRNPGPTPRTTFAGAFGELTATFPARVGKRHGPTVPGPIVFSHRHVEGQNMNPGHRDDRVARERVGVREVLGRCGVIEM